MSRSVTSAELARLAGLETGGTVGTAADAAAVGSRAGGEVVSLRALRTNIATAAAAVMVGTGVEIYKNQKALEAVGLLFALYDTFDEVQKEEKIKLIYTFSYLSNGLI